MQQRREHSNDPILLRSCVYMCAVGHALAKVGIAHVLWLHTSQQLTPASLYRNHSAKYTTQRNIEKPSPAILHVWNASRSPTNSAASSTPSTVMQPPCRAYLPPTSPHSVPKLHKPELPEFWRRPTNSSPSFRPIFHSSCDEKKIVTIIATEAKRPYGRASLWLSLWLHFCTRMVAVLYLNVNIADWLQLWQQKS